MNKLLMIVVTSFAFLMVSSSFAKGQQTIPWFKQSGASQTQYQTVACHCQKCHSDSAKE